MGKSAIPPELEGEVMKRADKGMSTREIAKWLGAEHKIKISHVAVARFVRATHKMRGELTTAVAREVVAPIAGSTLREEVEDIATCRKLFEKAAGEGDYLAASRLKTALTQSRALLMKYSGAETGDGEKPHPVIMVPPESDD